MSFDKAVEYVFVNEGRYSDDDYPTAWGVILPILKQMGMAGDLDGDGDVDNDDIRRLATDRSFAKKVYFDQWWDRYGFGRFKDAQVATKIFDTFVNMGAHQASLITQRALRACGIKVTEDGKIGPSTLKAIHTIAPHVLLIALCSEQAGIYRVIANKRPAQFARYLEGWLNRAYKVPQ